MHSIVTALEEYQLTYGCVPITNNTICGPAAGTYSRQEAGAWDYSSQGGTNGSGFMGFLKTAGFMPSVPIDPVNNMAGDDVTGYYSFRYYCYPGTGPLSGVELNYWSEASGWQFVSVIPQVVGGVTWTDSTFNCS